MTAAAANSETSWQANRKLFEERFELLREEGRERSREMQEMRAENDRRHRELGEQMRSGFERIEGLVAGRVAPVEQEVAALREQVNSVRWGWKGVARLAGWIGAVIAAVYGVAKGVHEVFGWISRP